MQRVICEVCGNEFDGGGGSCPYCQAQCPAVQLRNEGLLSLTVNLKQGMPLVQQALDRLDREALVATKQGVKVLTLIHGYGSSGAGGAIKDAVRRHLEFLRHKGRIREIHPGETFEGRSGRGRQLLRRFPFLAGHRDLNRANPGITLVVL